MESSCNCVIDNCDQRIETRVLENGTSTNLFIPDCRKPSGFNCNQSLIFRQDVQPQNRHGYDIINPRAFSEKQASGYYEFPCNIDSCEKRVFTSNDPTSHQRCARGAASRSRQTTHKQQHKISDTRHRQRTRQLREWLPNILRHQRRRRFIFIQTKHKRIPSTCRCSTQKPNVTSILFRDPMGAYKPHYERHYTNTKRSNHLSKKTFRRIFIIHRRQSSSTIRYNSATNVQIQSTKMGTSLEKFQISLNFLYT